MDYLKLNVNGELYEIDKKYEKETLLFVLRNVLRLTGTKKGCGTNDCGACRVIMNGKPVNSCVVPMRKANGSEVITIEGISKGNGIHPIQEAYVEAGAVQCGFCTPGMVMSTKALLDENPKATEEEIREALAGNICRCTGYEKIVDAVKLAQDKLDEN
ncbi:(2Fe-2S)-binding protein [Clostridium sediminicola]|uniref:(2Fe-2S)-binding protein n=1 Tax=Clostridium sediminicola TaxID=3114879 RepID=UPI0031F1E7A0